MAPAADVGQSSVKLITLLIAMQNEFRITSDDDVDTSVFVSIRCSRTTCMPSFKLRKVRSESR